MYRQVQTDDKKGQNSTDIVNWRVRASESVLALVYWSCREYTIVSVDTAAAPYNYLIFPGSAKWVDRLDG